MNNNPITEVQKKKARRLEWYLETLFETDNKPKLAIYWNKDNSIHVDMWIFNEKNIDTYLAFRITEKETILDDLRNMNLSKINTIVDEFRKVLLGGE